jgi:EAL domain-containing protein (putative c-di-GMP-specific phosphodiesterase class I)|tara:strand:+ start:2190 stop:2432 length:243 start_codon:yes stop_codon:yes gene_type:complete
LEERVSRPTALFDESHCDNCACGDGLDFSFSFAFQPIVDVSTASVYAYEALVRGPAGEPASTILARDTPVSTFWLPGPRT